MFFGPEWAANIRVSGLLQPMPPFLQSTSLHVRGGWDTAAVIFPTLGASPRAIGTVRRESTAAHGPDCDRRHLLSAQNAKVGSGKLFAEPTRGRSPTACTICVFGQVGPAPGPRAAKIDEL